MNIAAGDEVWRNCNICKSPIGFGRDYFVCSVSTCNRKRTGLIFCGLPCFEAHLPEARHRDAWAEQVKAPTRAEWEAALKEESGERDEAAAGAARRAAAPSGATSAAAGERRTATIVHPGAAPAAAGGEDREVEIEVLVVVSKLKKFVREWSGMNTSDAAMSVLSDHLREICREAIRQAGLDGRRTVLDRDFVKVIAQRRAGV